MKQVIAIGGGGFSRKANERSLEQYLLEQTGKKHPRILFLPQASNESRDYIVQFYEVFSELGAKPSWVSLFGTVKPTRQEHVLEQDLIFVGGGNTRSMLALWREWHMDELLRQAYNKGVVLAGVSAGAICWFQQGVTDSIWPLGVIPCLGIVSGSCCPHYDTEAARKPAYLHMTKKDEIMPGIALEDGTAAHYIDGQLRYILTKPGKKVHLVSDGKQQDCMIECHLLW